MEPALAQVVPAPWMALMEAEMLLRLAVAAVLGGLLGLERERLGKPAGLRTNVLICIGAALFTELSLDLPASRGAQGDPARIAAQIVTGIGFLGAGTILHARGRVTGLTTAAAVWVTAAIGMAVGAQAYGRAVGATAIVLVALVLLGRLEMARLDRRKRLHYLVQMGDADGAGAAVERVFGRRGLAAVLESVERRNGRTRMVWKAAGPGSAHDGVVQELASLPGVMRVARKR